MTKWMILALFFSALTACPGGGGGGGYGPGGSYGGGSAVIKEPYMNIMGTQEFHGAIAISHPIKIRTHAQRLTDKYGFSEDKAAEIILALELWSKEDSQNATENIELNDATFKILFGVERIAAVEAVQALSFGQAQAMTNLTAESAENLGISRAQAQMFMKDMYKDSLKQADIDADSINW